MRASKNKTIYCGLRMKAFGCMLLMVLACSYSRARDTLSFAHAAEVPHPRLLLLKNQEQALLQEVTQNPHKRKLHDAIIGQCDSMIPLQPITRTLQGRRLLQQSREFLKRIFYLSYAYRTTGNFAYAHRAETEMLAVAAFSDWNAPQHFLDAAEMATGMAFGYDWLYHLLSPQSKSKIAQSIIEFALKPSLQPAYNKWLQYENNWNQVCNAGLLVGALAVYEQVPELAETISKEVLKALRYP